MDQPWQFWADVSDDERGRLDRLVALAAALAAITFASQWQIPAPYGRFDNKDGKWGPPVHQRIGHVLNDGLWGVILFIIILYRSACYLHFGYVNTTFALIWLCHFVQRGFFHPFLMRYSSPKVALGIPITGLTLAFFSYTLATFLCAANYSDDYIWDYRFQCGIALFLFGFFVNRTSDWILRNLRPKSGVDKYQVPQGWLFTYISCPNYLGEAIQWLGWAIATCSWVGFTYFCFTLATFIPRARHNHQWYKSKFKNYPPKRKALIPFIF